MALLGHLISRMQSTVTISGVRLRGWFCKGQSSPLKPNSITIAGSELVRSWFELKFDLSSSLLSANYHELPGSRPNSITLSGSKLVRSRSPTSFEAASVIKFGFYPLTSAVALNIGLTISKTIWDNRLTIKPFHVSRVHGICCCACIISMLFIS